MSSKDGAARSDGVILSTLQRHDLADEMLVDGMISVKGYFNVEFVEDGDGDEALAGYYQTFDCREADLPVLAQDDEVEVVDHGIYRYLRQRANGTGRVLVILGSTLDG